VIIDRFDFIRPILAHMPPEWAHAVTIRAMGMGLAGHPGAMPDPILAIERFGLKFANPLGLAAGFDKNGRALRGALKLGFGFAEFGTVTPRPQPGNPKPRVFRLAAQRAVINRLGFNNQGLDAATRRITLLRARQDRPPGWIGGNIGRNKDSTDAAADYVAGAAALSPLIDYLTVNVSSPNTPGLRALQNRSALTELLSAVQAALVRPIPVLVKIAPDLTQSELEDIIETALETRIAGIIVSNTTTSRPSGIPADFAAETGGLSGPPLFPLSTEMLRRTFRLTRGHPPLIGVGGIASADDAYVKIRSGASLLQLYTALIYEGPKLIGRILTGLAARLRADGFASVGDAVGVDCQ
jgi:dihydroorotate dehydrogenase